MDGNFVQYADDAAPRSFAPRHSGRPNRVRTRREVRLVGRALYRLKYNPAKEPTQASTDETCLLRATPACCDFAHLTLRISQHRSASSQRKPRYRLCTSFLVLPTSSEICPRAYVRESNPRDKRRGLLVLPSASCSATPQRSRPKPQQPDLFIPRYASMLSIC